MVNLFSTPLTFFEWVVGMMALGVVNMLLVFLCSAATAWLLYGVNMFILGLSLIPFIFSLLFSGWFIGFFICGLLIRWGLKAQDFVFTVGWIFAPFSAIYYPVDALPPTVQRISKCLPMTYVFEAMRSMLLTGTLPKDYLLTSFGLDMLYLILSLFFFWSMFELSKEKGLARLE